MISDINAHSVELLIKDTIRHVNQKMNLEFYSYVRTSAQLTNILDNITDAKIIVGYFVDRDFCTDLKRYCDYSGYQFIDLSKQFENVFNFHNFENYQQTLDDEYFDKVGFIEFAIENDDGRTYTNIEKADIVLLGISRTGKTPLSIYLASRGYYVVNIPLFIGMEIPDKLFEISKYKIFGLINDPKKIYNIRKRRINDVNNSYASEEMIVEELNMAFELYDKIGCEVINTQNSAVEELASSIETKIKECS